MPGLQIYCSEYANMLIINWNDEFFTSIDMHISGPKCSYRRRWFKLLKEKVLIDKNVLKIWPNFAMLNGSGNRRWRNTEWREFATGPVKDSFANILTNDIKHNGHSFSSHIVKNYYLSKQYNGVNKPNNHLQTTAFISVKRHSPSAHNRVEYCVWNIQCLIWNVLLICLQYLQMCWIVKIFREILVPIMSWWWMSFDTDECCCL